MKRQPIVSATHRYRPLSRAVALIVHSRALLLQSFLLFVATVALTWLGYSLAVNAIDNATAGFTAVAPATTGIWGTIKHSAWVAGSWLLQLISRLVAFYLSFLLAYTLTSPGYSLLSATAERLEAGERFEADAALTLSGILRDIGEGLKIALFGIAVTIVAIMVNFLPVIGQVLAVLLYTFYSTLMFIDYPTSRRRWSLGAKLDWLRRHRLLALRLGLIPTLLGMIPLLNIFAVALLFPVLTVYATVNFTATQLAENADATRGGGQHG